MEPNAQDIIGMIKNRLAKLGKVDHRADAQKHVDEIEELLDRYMNQLRGPEDGQEGN